MIKNMQPLNMCEVKKILVSLEDNEKKAQIEAFVKKFSKINKEKAEKLEKELEALGLLKVKKDHIVKIIDTMPEDPEDLNKIFTDVGLDEDEANKILEVI